MCPARGDRCSFVCAGRKGQLPDLMASVGMNIQSRVSAQRSDYREAAIAAAEVAAAHAAAVDRDARFPQEAMASLREGRLPDCPIERVWE